MAAGCSTAGGAAGSRPPPVVNPRYIKHVSAVHVREPTKIKDALLTLLLDPEQVQFRSGQLEAAGRIVDHQMPAGRAFLDLPARSCRDPAGAHHVERQRDLAGVPTPARSLCCWSR